MSLQPDSRIKNTGGAIRCQWDIDEQPCTEPAAYIDSTIGFVCAEHHAELEERAEYMDAQLLRPEIRACWEDASMNISTLPLDQIDEGREQYSREPDGYALYIESGNEDAPQIWVVDFDNKEIAESMRYALTFLDAEALDDNSNRQGEAREAIETLRLAAKGAI